MIACYVSMSANAQQRRISLTGFNQDVIADPDLNASPDTLTTSGVDTTTGNVLFVNGYSNGGTADAGGLPTNGSFVSPAGHYFQLKRYNTNNSLELNLTSNPTGTLTFNNTDQMSYDSLFVLTTSGSGNSSLSYQVNFTDNTSASGVIAINDWFCNGCTTYAINNLTRADRTTGALTDAGLFALYEYSIPIAPANQTKNVRSITFTVQNIGNSSYANIFAITGFSLGLLPVSLNSFNASVRNGEAFLQWQTGAEQNNIEFIVERAPSISPNAFTKVGTVTGSSSSTGSVYSFTNTPGIQGTYLYRLSQQDADGNVKVLGIKSLTFDGNVKWVVQDLGTQWRLITDGAYRYRITDMSGKILQGNEGSGTTTISKPFAHGIYLLQVWQNGTVRTEKLIN